jgi:MFS family permease
MTAFSHRPSQPPARAAGQGAAWVVICGVVAAIHVGKLPAMLPLVADEMRLTRIETGWLLAVFQIAGMLLGVLGGLLSDKIGRKRLVMSGLALLGFASAFAGLLVQTGSVYGLVLLLALRTVESFAFIACVLPGPGLLQGMVSKAGLRRYMGWWSAYMPTGMAIGLVVAPMISDLLGWRGVWVIFGLINLLLVWVVYVQVPSDTKSSVNVDQQLSFWALLRATLQAPGPWLLALLFLCYAAQWSGLFGFLPTIYKEQGINALTIGWLTALAVFFNAIGNVIAGLPSIKLKPWVMVCVATCVMSICSAVVLGTVERFIGIDFSFAIRYGAVMTFSLIGGFIPSTIFGLVASFAPTLKNGEKAIGTTSGMFQQGSALGQVMTPPLVAWTVQRSGDWASAWWVMAGLGIGCLVAAIGLKRKGESA